MCGNFDCNSLDEDIYYDEKGNKYCTYNCGRILDVDLDHDNSCRWCE